MLYPAVSSTFVKTNLPDGSSFQGPIQDGLPHGEGEQTFPSGATFTGQFVKGILHGYGVQIYSNKDRYEGDFERGKKQGNGKYTRANGMYYIGSFKDDKLNGVGKKVYPTGECCEGLFTNGIFIGTFSNIGDITFAKLILGKPADIGVPPSYTAGIISDFLMENGFFTLSSNLKTAQTTYVEAQDPSKIRSSANWIIVSLQRRQESECLLFYGSKTHALGLNIVKKNSDSIFLEIFNSGLGLRENHKKKNKKFQTMLRFKTSIKNLNEKTVQQWLQKKTTTSECYQSLLAMPDTSKIEEDENRAVYQTKQKGKNCSVEWIFAYLKNKMTPLEYNTIRLKLFETCLEKLHNASLPQEQRNEFATEFRRKIAKRKDRIAKLTALEFQNKRPCVREHL